jgi:hypothetical protein
VNEFLGRRGIFRWDENYYALNMTKRLQLEQKGERCESPNTLQHAGRGGSPVWHPARIRPALKVQIRINADVD